MPGAIVATAGSVVEGLWGGAGIIHPGRNDELPGREARGTSFQDSGKAGKETHDRRSTE